MDTWNCCRMCLGSQSLNPIFAVPDYHEKYTDILLSTTGIKVELNDNLPQQICTSCISFINNSYKFRKKCEENQNLLAKRCNDKTQDVKTETIVFIVKPEDDSQATIDISHLISRDINGKDICNDYNSDFNNDAIDFESKPQDVVEEKINTIFNDKKRKRRLEKPVKKSLRKRDSGEKKERVKEKIECEYCHKILTSKLSLRNHYKIHTGFDVVCEHCGKKFITRRLLLMHCRAKHGYEKTDKCSYCDYTASNAEQVKIHERLHTGEKPFVCAECGASFHRKSSYLQHVAIHLPDKTVQCEQCPARFKSVTLMKIHANRHRAAQYSFKCRVCDNSFARRRNVVRHLTRIHGLHPQPDMIDRLKIA